MEELIHLQAPKDGTTTYDYFVAHGWAHRWPAEEIWKVRKRESARVPPPAWSVG